MRNLMKFGIVLVVLAMVTSVGFAKTQEYEGPDGGTWCDDDNWDEETPRHGKKDDAEIANENTVVIGDGCIGADPTEPAELDELLIEDGGVQVGSAAYWAYLRVDGDLEMADGKGSDFAILNVVNGVVYVEDQSKKLMEDGSGEITVAAGSLLVLDDGVYFGASNDDDSVYTLDIAGDLEINGDRLEHRGGHLIINQTGGNFIVEKTSRLSMEDDSVVTVDISGGTCSFDKIELAGDGDDGCDTDYSMSIKVSGGSWDGAGEDIKFKKDDQILEIKVTGGTFEADDIENDADDSVLNIDVSGGVVEIDSVDADSGTISITGGDVDLGTVKGGTDITIDGARLDVEELEMNSVDIKGAGQLVVGDMAIEDLDALVADGDIGTSDVGKVIISDDGVTHDDKVTLQAVYPFEVDIKPGGCPNPLRVNFRGNGVLPVAVVGSDTFDVTTIDPDTVTLIGVPLLRSSVGDVSTAGDVCNAGPDGTPDLVLKFRRRDVLDALEDLYGELTLLPNRAELSLILLAETTEGALVGGTDSLVILNRGAIKRRR